LQIFFVPVCSVFNLPSNINKMMIFESKEDTSTMKNIVEEINKPVLWGGNVF